MPRKYEQRARAEKRDETRQRIVEAIASLHMSVGPAKTTVSAIAEAAKVERLTVYRHFPDEASMYQACGSHWVALHPAPDISRWTAISDPGERIAAALPEIYAFYRETEPMTANILRDAPALPELARIARLAGWIDAARQVLSGGWSPANQSAVTPLVALAVDFNTWQLLARKQGLTDEAAAALMLRGVVAVAESYAPRLA